MMSKKVLSLVLCMCMLASLLTGCGLGGNSAVDVQLDADSQITTPVDADAEAEGAGEDLSEEILLADEAEINYETKLVKGTEKKSAEETKSQDADVVLNADELDDSDVILELIDKNLEQEEPVQDESKADDEPFDLIEPDLFEEGIAEYADNTIMVKVKKNFKEKTLNGLMEAGVGKLEPLFELEKHTWYTAYLLKGVNVNDVLEQVRAVNGVETAEYNYAYEAASVTEPAAAAEAVSQNPQFTDQWYMQKFGILEGWAEARNASLDPELGEEAVPAAPGEGTVVAVIDTGVDYNHVDLKANMWVNHKEIPDNGIDDDNNGYRDDYYGIDMIQKKGSGMDDHGHGTHVAGIIAASNNKEGVVGLAYGAQIMAIKVGDEFGHFLQNNVAEAIIYAFDHGADVINMSFGGSANSVAVRDALTVAHSRCVLVASAGNEALPNEFDGVNTSLPIYPAAHSFVLGVMSIGPNMIESPFTNWDRELYNQVEYEVYAPGEQILSTIPGDKYAKMSGTSMSAPVVAAQAAVLRSIYADRNTYPSKFIAGQIAGTADSTVICSGRHPGHYVPGAMNLYNSIVELPVPDIGIGEYTIFDTKGYTADTEGIADGAEEVNNGDGIMDAGEIVALGFMLKNRWGKSENTTISLKVENELNVEKGYITLLNNDVDYGSVGTYSENDCGKLYNEDDVWVGWENPFYIKIGKNCPNDHQIVLEATVTYENGLDENDETVYESSKKYVVLTVRRGTVLPSKVTEDMTLTSDNYYILSDSMTIEEGARVRVEAGTQIQFWSSNREDAYVTNLNPQIKVRGEFISEGTEENPVEMFTSELVAGTYGKYAKIFTEGTGYAALNYTNITEAYLTIDKAANCEFRGHRSVITDIERAENCAFYKTTGTARGAYFGCIFVDCCIAFPYGMNNAENCVFYGNNGIDMYGSYKGASEYATSNAHVPAEITIDRIFKNDETGVTYVALDMGSEQKINFDRYLPTYGRFAEMLGGALLCFDDIDEYEFIQSVLQYDTRTTYLFGAYADRANGKYLNYDGTELPSGIPVDEGKDYNIGYLRNGIVCFEALEYVLNDGMCLIEIPGEPFITDIQLSEYLVSLDLDAVYQIEASLKPVLADAESLIYESQDKTAVTVSEEGIVTPVAIGSTTIRVYSPDYAVYNYITINVTDTVELENITLASDSIDLNVGGTERIKVNFHPSNTTERELTYVSSDENIVYVSETGLMYGISEGTADITISYNEEIQTVLKVDVEVAAEKLYFTEEMYVTGLLEDDGDAFCPQIEPADAADTDLTWTSSNPEVCYVNESGKLIKLKAGMAELKAAAVNRNLEDTVTVAVIEGETDATVVKMQDGRDNTIFALLDDGTLWMWGGNYRVPTKVKVEEEHIKDFTVDEYGMFLLDDAGTVRYYVKESGSFTSLVLDDEEMEIENVASFSETHGGDNIAFAITEDGAVWYIQSSYGNYGQNIYGQINIDAKITKAVTHYSYGMMLADDGTVYCLQNNGEAAIVFEDADDICKSTALKNTTHDVHVFKDEQVYVFSMEGKVNGTYSRFNRSEVIRDHSFYIENGIVNIKGTEINYRGDTHGYFGSEYVQIPGITNAIEVFDYGNNVYIQTANGQFFAVGEGDNYALGNSSLEEAPEPVKVHFGLVNNPEPLAVTSWNVEDDSSIILDYNQNLYEGTNYGQITLQDRDGNYVSFAKKMDLDKLIVKPRNTLKSGETYTITIPASALTERGGTYNQVFNKTFIYVEEQPADENAPVTKMMEFNHRYLDNGEAVTHTKKIVLLENGSLWIWGGASAEKTKLPIENVKDFAVWSEITSTVLYVVTEDGTLTKYNVSGGDFANSLTADTYFTPMTGIAALYSNQYQSDSWFAITEDGDVYGWGYNDYYQFGTGTISGNAITTPFKLEIEEPIKTVVSAEEGTAYLAESGNVYLSGGTNTGTVYKTITHVYSDAVDIYGAEKEWNYCCIYIDLGDSVECWDFSNGSGFTCETSRQGEVVGAHNIYIEEGIVYAKSDDQMAHYYCEEYLPIPEITNAVSVFDFRENIYIQCADGSFYGVGAAKNGALGETGADGSRTPVLISFGAVKTDSEDSADIEIVNDAVINEELMAERHYWTSTEILTEWNDFVEKGYNTTFYNNAILNRIVDDNVKLWMVMTAEYGSQLETISMGGNYWGTISPGLIDKQIQDQDDDDSLRNINEGAYLTVAPSNTFPFVVKAHLEVNDEEVDVVENELVTFVVEFNRDMDTSIPLRVCFGSADPYTDYTVEGEYESPRVWKGTMQLTTIIENGYQYWSVSNGKAAGTSMKLYTDWGRFPFKIDTTAAQALTMQAETTREGIKLTWSQDDFDTLAGYNIYRSTEEDGLYTKLNTTVIPADVKEWFDGNVEPGETYYYNFTVVQTDFVESEPSGKVVATAMDTMAPNIYHSPVYHAFTGSNLVISATVTDNVTINAATLYYRIAGSEAWNSQAMNNYNDKYSAVIPADVITVEGVEYYIEATDGISVTVKDNNGEPFVISVQTAVSDSDKGDVDDNGTVDVVDAMIVLMAANDRKNLTAEEFARADLDDSGELEAWEALRILMYANGSVGSVLP